MRLYDLCIELDRLFMKNLAESWDNPGLMVGDHEQPVSRALLALDVSSDLIREARRRHADLLLVHHPLLFHPVKEVSSRESTGLLLLKAVQSNIAVYAAHTNMDSAQNGINHELATALGIENQRPMQPIHGNELAGMGRFGKLGSTSTVKTVLERAKTLFSSSCVRFNGDLSRRVKNIGICSGSGGDLVRNAIELGLDLFITGDVKHDQFQEASAKGLSLADVGHAQTDWFGFKESVKKIWAGGQDVLKIPLIVSRKPWAPIDCLV
ncbi:MAG: Nif3-like dinuclear metal center hexameric protein [Deltaproteobacteria bacterium]|nr:Nif3-like dinuclear metal center hexameric protein [Deltaproteobacteria bacterium]